MALTPRWVNWSWSLLECVALQMLGSSYEADDAVQEARLRLSRSDAEAVDNLGGWTTGQPGPAACSRTRRFPTPQQPLGARWSPPSSPRRAKATSTSCCDCSTWMSAIHTDRVAVEMAAQRSSAGAPALSEEMRGVGAVALVFAGGAKAARLTLIDGLAGAVVSVGGRPMAVFGFTVRDGRVVVIELTDSRTGGLAR
jgi:hypothetical protein